MGGNCPKCGVLRKTLHRDHILARCNGGLDTPENIQLLCANCHEDKTGEDLKGRVFSTEARTKMSVAAQKNTRAKGFHHSPEAKAKMRVAHLGRAKASIETRAKMSAIRKGRWLREATNARRIQDSFTVDILPSPRVNDNDNP